MEQHQDNRLPLVDTPGALRLMNALRARARGLIGPFLLLAVGLLACVNLSSNPTPWQDEGGTLTLARALAEDGVYATRSSEGYQSFGYVQSVGPPVILPIALSFKLFGVGLLQGRLVMAGFLVLTVALFYQVGRQLSGRGVALVAVALLLGVPAVRLLHYGRQAIGEVPALGMFLAAYLVWLRSLDTPRVWRWALAGGLLGLAMITKLLYAPVGFGTLALLVLLDCWYYRQGAWRGLLVIGAGALTCVLAWWGWQAWYFGLPTFLENAAKLRALAASTSGFGLSQTMQALKFLTGFESGHFYYFWGFAALPYALVRCRARDRAGLAQAFLLLFILLWLGYWMIWITPWAHYALAPLALTALLVAALARDLVGTGALSRAALAHEWRAGQPGPAARTLALALLLAVLVGYADQMSVRTDVLVHDPTPAQLVTYLNATVPSDAVIETWERELGILTDHIYHFPDQSTLIQFHAASRGRGGWDFGRGVEYFQRYRPAYLVAGWYARQSHLYDDFLAEHGRLLTTIGTGEARYQVYQLQLP